MVFIVFVIIVVPGVCIPGHTYLLFLQKYKSAIISYVICYVIKKYIFQEIWYEKLASDGQRKTRPGVFAWCTVFLTCYNIILGLAVAV